MGQVEYWVFRVVVAGGASLNLSGADRIDRLAALWGVVRGRYHVIGGDICEEIDVYDEQQDAIERARKEHARTGYVHKVTLNAEF